MPEDIEYKAIIRIVKAHANIVSSYLKPSLTDAQYRFLTDYMLDTIRVVESFDEDQIEKKADEVRTIVNDIASEIEDARGCLAEAENTLDRLQSKIDEIMEVVIS